MRNIKLVIEYDGTNYHGWQIQPGLNTIQGVIESGLSVITKTQTQITGAGRTDAGVHALDQAANFRTESRMTPEQFKAALNSILPKDIAIRHAEEVPDEFHARYSATSRTYKYTIINCPTPSAFLRNYAYQVRQTIDINQMAEAANMLLGTHDFSSFASVSDSVHSFIRTVSEAQFRIIDTECSMFDIKCPMIRFRITANAFLRGMVRAIVGTLLEIGKGRIAPNQVAEILESKDRSKAGPSAPANGLCLVKVSYEQLPMVELDDYNNE